MVVMEHGVGLPGKPGLHLDPRMVHEPKVVDVEQLSNIHEAIDGEEKERENKEAVIEKELKWAHSYHRVGCGRVVPMEK